MTSTMTTSMTTFITILITILTTAHTTSALDSVCDICDCQPMYSLISCANRGLADVPPVLEHDKWMVGRIETIDFDWNFIRKIDMGYWDNFPNLLQVTLRSERCVDFVTPSTVAIRATRCQVRSLCK